MTLEEMRQQPRFQSLEKILLQKEQDLEQTWKSFLEAFPPPEGMKYYWTFQGRLDLKHKADE